MSKYLYSLIDKVMIILLPLSEDHVYSLFESMFEQFTSEILSVKSSDFIGISSPLRQLSSFIWTCNATAVKLEGAVVHQMQQPITLKYVTVQG